eukprot:scaffold66437_cov18-Tisochrysis_lutea.AAC.2
MRLGRRRKINCMRPNEGGGEREEGEGEERQREDHAERERKNGGGEVTRGGQGAGCRFSGPGMACV